MNGVWVEYDPDSSSTEWKTFWSSTKRQNVLAEVIPTIPGLHRCYHPDLRRATRHAQGCACSRAVMQREKAAEAPPFGSLLSFVCVRLRV